MIEQVTQDGFTTAAVPHKFEAGTPPIAEIVALGAAVDYLSSRRVDVRPLLSGQFPLADAKAAFAAAADKNKSTKVQIVVH